MQIKANNIDEYLQQLPEERKTVIRQLRNAVLKNLPKGFEESFNYGMFGWVIPHSLYPKGYHCDPKLPLPFMGMASQKNFVAVYHMGIYADKNLFDWFTAEYTKVSKNKLDMGKSCIRFKNIKQIPFDLIGELASKMSVNEWIALYEKNLMK